MARTDLPITDLTMDGATDDPSGTSADAANGMVVELGNSWPRQTLEEIVVRVSNGDTSSTDITLKAGPNPPAVQGALGDKTITVEAGTDEFIGPFDSSRFLSPDDGTDPLGLWMDVSNDTAVTMTAFRVPRG